MMLSPACSAAVALVLLPPQAMMTFSVLFRSAERRTSPVQSHVHVTFRDMYILRAHELFIYLCGPARRGRPHMSRVCQVVAAAGSTSSGRSAPPSASLRR